MNSLNGSVRFSQSPIWSLQRRYFEEQGIEAWRDEQVPHYITNNPALAKAYAEIVFGIFRDRVRLNKQSSDPIYLLELGAGSGRFCYHFLKHLSRMCEHAPFQAPYFCYVLSDLPMKNIDFWRNHPRLKHFTERGMLDFASFDAVNGTELHLMLSGGTLYPQSLSQCLIVIANYFFDSIPQDLYLFREGNAYEVTANVQAPPDSERMRAAELIEQLTPQYELQPVANFDYPEEIFWQLESYKEKLKQSYVLFPTVGLRCLDRLRQLSTEGLVLLAADKGDHRIERLESQNVPVLVRHGSFSLMVNYHAFNSYFEMQGARAYFTPHVHQHLNIACMLMLPDALSFTETANAYRTFVESFGPDDFFSIKKHLDRYCNEMPLEQLAAGIRLSGYDPRQFQQFIPRLLMIVPQCSVTEKRDMLAIIHAVWDWYYPIGEQQDLAFDLGMLLYQMDACEQAIVYFERSLAAYGETAPVYYNMAVCYYRLMIDETAAVYLEKCLQLEPGHCAAKALLSNIVS